MQWGMRAPALGTLDWRRLSLVGLLGVAACSARSGTEAVDDLAVAQAAVAPQVVTSLPPGAAPVGFVPTQVQFGSVVPVVTETGFVRLSVDGLGTLDSSGVVRVEKPAGASVRRAFIAAASAGTSGRLLANGDVTVDGAPVSWQISTPSSIGSWNHWAEVTSLVSAKIDAAEPGPVEVTLGEADSAGIDGEILAVIFDTAERESVSTVVLLFGAQQVQGDTFNVRLSDPVDLDNPAYRLDLSLGIAFSYVESEFRLQRSLVDVNGRRMTSSAGGMDDGLGANGALLTVGGVGDSTDNPPPDELAPDFTGNSRFDDELYDLRPFTQTGDTEISVFTINPTTDDNVFFSALFASGAAVINEGILIAPTSSRAPVGTSHTLTATVQNDLGNPVVARDVTFTILAGPNAGETHVASTDAAGEAELEYAGDDGPGVDEIRASFVDSLGVTRFSSVALEEWFAIERPPVAACSDIEKPIGLGCSIDVQPAEVGRASADPDGDPLAFVLAPTGPFGLGATPVTLTVTDTGGLADSCRAVVTAVDATPPVLSLPDPIVLGCAGPNGAAVTFEVGASDDCSEPSVRCSASGQPLESGATLPIGTTRVTCDATDAAGNLASGAFSVTVTGDPAGPVIQCNAPDVVSGATTITATASDGCDAVVSVEVVDYRCGDGGRDRDGHDSCGVTVRGASLIVDAGDCTSGSLEWTVRAVDAGGNATTQECRVSAISNPL